MTDSIPIKLPLICKNGKYHLTNDLVIDEKDSIVGENLVELYINLNGYKLTVLRPDGIRFYSISICDITNGFLDKTTVIECDAVNINITKCQGLNILRVTGGEFEVYDSSLKLAKDQYSPIRATRIEYLTLYKLSSF